MMLRIQGLRKSFGKRVLWSDLELEAEQGTMTALTGVSGAGKSTARQHRAGWLRGARMPAANRARTGTRRI